jgi:hypothetical protein
MRQHGHTTRGLHQRNRVARIDARPRSTMRSIRSERAREYPASWAKKAESSTSTK